MFETFTAAKVKAFQGYAGCPWTQGKAEDLWQEKMWKLNLSIKELSALSEGWARFVVNGDTAQLNSVCNTILVRLDD
jgi:hypothetical protein